MNKKLLIKLFYIAFFVKAFYFFGSYYLFTHQVSDINTNIGLLTIDHDIEDHFIPLENWWDEGIYYDNAGDRILYAARPPGYAPFYLPLYILTNGETARSLFTLVNLLMDVISCVFLFLLVKQLTKNNKVAWIAFFIYVLLPYISVYSNRGKSEVLSTALIIIGSYFYFQYLLGKTKKLSNLMFAGLIMAISTLIRPSIAIFPLFGAIPIVFVNRHSFPSIIKSGVSFSLPIILLVGSWVGWSSYKADNFVPIINRESFADPEVRTLFKFIRTINGDAMSWIKGSEAEWFALPGSLNYSEEAYNGNPFDKTTFSENFTLDSLKSLRKLYWEVTHDGENINKNDSLFLAKAASLISIYKEERTLWHRIKTETIILKKFFITKYAHGTALQKTTIFFQLGKLYWLGLYYFVLMFLAIGVVFAILRWNKPLLFLFLFSALYVVFLGNFMGQIENRYLAAVIPYFVILAAFGCYHLLLLVPNKTLRQKLV